MSNIFPADYASGLGTGSVSATTSTGAVGASMDPIFSVVSAVIEPIGNVIDDLSYTPQEQAAAAAAATQAAANLAAAQSGATTAAAAEATKQQAIKYAFAAALVLAAVWAFSRRR
jgi:ribosomal protein L12E/L44/L45/RPP1/RPP2